MMKRIISFLDKSVVFKVYILLGVHLMKGLLNNALERARIPAWEVGLGFDDDVEQLLVTFEGGYSTDGLGYHLQNGWLDIGLRKTSAVVLHKMKW